MKESRVCQVCERSFYPQRSVQKTCSKRCRDAWRRHLSPNRRISMTKQLKLNTGTVGALNELRVCCDLFEKGFEVFRALSPSSKSDLVGMKNGICYRIEVKTAFKKLRTGEFDHDKPRHPFDILGVCTSDQIVYFDVNKNEIDVSEFSVKIEQAEMDEELPE